MNPYIINESDKFLSDVEEAAVWILLNNIDQSESFADKKIAEFKSDIDGLKNRLKSFPDSGENDLISNVRKFPIYNGRYSAKWSVNHSAKSATLIALVDSKYPKNLREFYLDDEVL